MTTIIDLVYIDSAGFHYADYPTFLTWLQDQYKAIYGVDVYLEADSQDGQWIAINARAHYDSAALAAAVYNSFSPGTAQGAGLSSVIKINGIKRQVPTFSTADLTIVGQVGTLISNGVAQDTLSQKWNLPASVLIPISGSIIVTATAQEIGTISASAGTINKIYTPTLGWQTVTNVLAATPGAPVESDAALRLRQTTSVALASSSVFEGTRGAVENVTGVTRVQAYENDTGAVDVNGIPAHSIAIVAQGGDALAIATAIAVHKTPGTRTVGTTSEIIYDKYGMPNTINFYRPTIVPIKVEVDITAYTGYSGGYDSLIKAAVAAYINALKIGDDVLITKLYVPANLPGTLPGSTFDIVVIKIAKTINPFGTINVPILYNEAASCLESDVSIVVIP